MIELARDSFFSILFHLAPRFANVLTFILIGHLAGPTEAGAFALATTFLLIFTTVVRGLDDLVVRQVSREPTQVPRYLTNFLILRLGLSSALYAGLLFVVRAIFNYPDSTAIPIAIMGLSLTPDSLAYVAQAVMMGQRRFGAPALVLAGVNLSKLAVGAVLLLNGGNLRQIAWVWFAGSTLGALALIGLAVRQVGGLRQADWLDWRPLIRNWRAALPFLLITTLMTLESQTDTILLSAFHDEAQVGLYNAATTVAFSLAMFSQAYRFAIYPLMARYALQSPEKLSRLYTRSMRYLGMLTLPMAAGIIVLAPEIVSMVFSPKFQLTIGSLRILMVALIFIFLNVPDARMMLVHDRQGQSLAFLIIGVATNIAINLALDRAWGAAGASLARLCSSFVFFILNHLYVIRFFSKLNIIQELAKPALATILMTTILWLVNGLPLIMSISMGVILYTGTLWLVGGIRPEDTQMLRQMANTWSKK